MNRRRLLALAAGAALAPPLTAKVLEERDGTMADVWRAALDHGMLGLDIGRRPSESAWVIGYTSGEQVVWWHRTKYKTGLISGTRSSLRWERA